MLRDLDIEVLSLQSFPGVPEVEEDGLTFHENALKKAREVSRHTSEAVLADDSGLEVDILGGEPGIHSARYSGPEATDETNNRMLLAQTRRGAGRETGGRFPVRPRALQARRPMRVLRGGLAGRDPLRAQGDPGLRL